MKKIVYSFLLLATIGLTTTAFTERGKYFEISKHIEIFANLYKEINTYYVDDIDPGHLMKIGIDAMLESLDPYTNYISEAQIEDYRYITEGKYHGIGAFVYVIDGFPTIVDPYENSPVSSAGIVAGDRILEVDGKSTQGKTAGQINTILKGYPGTSVDLTVERPSQFKSKKMTLVREEVNVENVPFSGLVKDGVGYINLTTFTRNAGRNVLNAFKELKDENPALTGVILDLRNNGGGLLNEAVNICNIWIPKNEVIVTTKGKVKEWDRSYNTRMEPADLDIPVAVLINKSSASASEIVSGVLQDYDRAILIGQRSYGKGLVQNTKEIGYNSKVKVTTAKYYIPSGRCIQSVQYQDGEPVDIDEGKRAKFKTLGGRPVLDGGGVKPDVKIERNDKLQVIKNLKKQYLIFHFATDYVNKNPKIEDPGAFKFANYDAFVQFANSKNFAHDTQTEKLLEKLKKKASEEDYSTELQSQIKALEQQITVAKNKDLKKYQAEITKLIEEEIVSRTHYQKGKIQHGLRNDEEVLEAIRILNNKTEYNKLLGK